MRQAERVHLADQELHERAAPGLARGFAVHFLLEALHQRALVGAAHFLRADQHARQPHQQIRFAQLHDVPPLDITHYCAWGLGRGGGITPNTTPSSRSMRARSMAASFMKLSTLAITTAWPATMSV